MNAIGAKALLSLVPLVLILGLTSCADESIEDSDPGPTTTTTQAPTDVPAFVGSKADYAQALVSCVGEQGWPGIVTDASDPEGEGAIRWDPVPEEQNEALDTAIQECLATLGAFNDAPASEEEVRASFDAFNAQFECLTAAGFSPDDPPSFASYLDEFQTSGSLMWDPISSLPDDQYSNAIEACPRP